MAHIVRKISKETDSDCTYMHVCFFSAEHEIKQNFQKVFLLKIKIKISLL